MSRALTIRRLVAWVVGISSVVGQFGPQNALCAEVTKEAVHARVLAKEGFNAREWGEDIENPFKELAADTQRKLKARGIEIERLALLEARLLHGEYFGANKKDFVNKDPKTLLVLDKGFGTHGDVYSLGPIIAWGDCNLMGDLVGSDLVWLAESSPARNEAVGFPLIPAAHDREYGWTRAGVYPRGRVRRTGTEKEAREEKAWRETAKKLSERVLGAEGRDINLAGETVTNPFASLTEEGRVKLRARGIDVNRLARLEAKLLAGYYYGNPVTFVNKKAEILVVVDGSFRTHGDLYSLGPILATGKAQFMGPVIGADLVWFLDNSSPRDETLGLPIILAPGANQCEIRPGCEYIWYGDYGLRSRTEKR
jgi:hypothetical protein